MKNDHVSLIYRILSALVRTAERPNTNALTTRNGLLVLSNTGTTPSVTLELVNQMREETPM